MVLTTEVQRIETELARSKITAEALMGKFQSATRADVKLACALYGYFGAGKEDVYLQYLMSRIRPAVTELILSGRVSQLAELEGKGAFTAELTDSFLETAISAGAQEATVWLLQLKERRFGFPDRDFSL